MGEFKPPQINLPEIKTEANVNLARPSIDIPPVKIQEPKEKEKEILPIIEEGFNPNIEIEGIDLGEEPPSINVDLENPPIDIPPVDTSVPEVELNKKVELPSLDALLSANAPEVQFKAPALLDIPDSKITANIELPKKIEEEEPELAYEPPDIDFDTNIGDQPPLIENLISGDPEKPFIVESKANKPDTAALKNIFNKDIKYESPEPRIKIPNIKEDIGKFGDALDTFGGEAKVDVDLGKGKISAEAKVGKKEDKKKDSKKAEPKEKPIQMKSFISQDVNAPIYPVRKIPKIKIFKGFPKKKKK